MGIYKSNDKTDFRTKLKRLKQIQKGTCVKLTVLDRRDLKEKVVIVYKNNYSGGDIEISSGEIEHYEDFDELVSFFYLRFRVLL